MEIEYRGGCLCGAVRFALKGRPLRVGLCHCLDCRKASGAPYIMFAVWPVEALDVAGEMSTFAKRSFCPRCGGRIGWFRNDEAEIMIGSLDNAPSCLSPDYELWVGRREDWLHRLEWAGQYEDDRRA